MKLRQFNHIMGWIVLIITVALWGIASTVIGRDWTIIFAPLISTMFTACYFFAIHRMYGPKLMAPPASPAITGPRDADWRRVFNLERDLYQGLPWHHGQFPDLATESIDDKFVVGGGPPDWWEDERAKLMTMPELPQTCPVCGSEAVDSMGRCMECADIEQAEKWVKVAELNPMTTDEEKALRAYKRRLHARTPMDSITAARHWGPPNTVHHNNSGGYLSPGGAGGSNAS